MKDYRQLDVMYDGPGYTIIIGKPGIPYWRKEKLYSFLIKYIFITKGI